MPLSMKALNDLISELIRLRTMEIRRLQSIADHYADRVQTIYVPKAATAEYRVLVDQSRFNVLPLVVTSVAQNLFVDGYRATTETGRPAAENADVWNRVWQPNRLDKRQSRFYRAAIKYGWSYATVVPGDPVPVITPHSPRKLTALYEDELNDEWPQAAMVVKRGFRDHFDLWRDPLSETSVDRGARITLYDEEFRYQLVHDGGDWRLSTELERHGLDRVPVVRFLSPGDEDEMPTGKVEPLLPAQRQLNQTTFSLHMAQHYAAFRQRWATGMALPTDENGNNVEPWNAAVNRVWHVENENARFGDFEQTSLDGYLNSRDKTLLYIATVSQIPPHHLITGPGISNISAEALAALEAAHRQDIADHQTSFGESIEQVMRLAGLAMGSDEAWEDTSAQVVWRDTTPRSLSQIADALGKLATQLAIPPRALWERIPGVTDQDIARWEGLAAEQDVLAELSTMLGGQEGEGGAGAPGAGPLPGGPGGATLGAPNGQGT